MRCQQADSPWSWYAMYWIVATSILLAISVALITYYSKVVVRTAGEPHEYQKHQNTSQHPEHTLSPETGD